MGKAKSCLRFESVAALGLGNSGAITWSEMANSKATACARLTSSSSWSMAKTSSGWAIDVLNESLKNNNKPLLCIAPNMGVLGSE